jgi:hypothetical protein
MKVSRHPFMRRLGVCLLGASPILFASGCNILGLTDDEPPPAQPITDAKAVAGMEVVGGMMEMIFSAGGEPATGETFPDYASGRLPVGHDRQCHGILRPFDHAAGNRDPT